MFCENVVLNDTGWLFGEKTVWTGEEQLVNNIQWIVVRCGTLLHDFVDGVVNTLLTKEVLKYMGEVMICRGGGGGNSHAGLEKVLTTLVFNANDTWTVPDGIANNEVSVRIFGGGGGGNANYGGAGGGGWMNNDIFKIGFGDQIKITIGDGGEIGSSGGATAFGSYLTASGGSAGKDDGGSGGSGGGTASSYLGFGGVGYQFGGGGSFNGKGGNGGPWGGGGGGLGCNAKGGDGGIYGGGGGGGAVTYNYINSYVAYQVKPLAGNGGTYGGGGGSCGDINFRSIGSNINGIFRDGGIGGEYGGNGYVGTYWYYDRYKHNIINTAINGTNTINLGIYGGEYNENLEGSGTYGSSGGGGGYGGCGGNDIGGGGGYGSNGGGGFMGGAYSGYYIAGGGGGYGGDGGYGKYGSGGGGGYGKNAKGGNGANSSDMWGGKYYGGGGGGGYYAAAYDGSNGNNSPATGGAGTIVDGIKYAYGGNSNNPGLGGVCIVQFYRWL